MNEKKFTINDCKIIDLPTVPDERGTLTFMETGNHIPFEMKRIYYMYGIPEKENRGDHANVYSEQVVIALNGKFDITIDDGKEKKTYTMNNPGEGLYIPQLIWVDIENFSPGSIILVLRPTPYDANDYIRNYEDYKKRVNDDTAI